MRRSVIKPLLSLMGATVAAEVALLGVVEATAAIRRRGEQPPSEGFPWEEQPEAELESGNERLKLYSEYEGLYEDMLREIEGAESRIFIETFIWQTDEWGRRFIDALSRKAREGIEVYAIFDEAANLGQPASFKRFPEEINLLRFRRVRGPKDASNPRTAHRDHRKIMTADGRRSKARRASGGVIGSHSSRRPEVWTANVFTFGSITVNREERCSPRGNASGWKCTSCPAPAAAIVFRSVSCGTNARGGRL